MLPHKNKKAEKTKQKTNKQKAGTNGNGGRTFGGIGFPERVLMACLATSYLYTMNLSLGGKKRPNILHPGTAADHSRNVSLISRVSIYNTSE